ncbi:hypothetical protein C1H46_034401 [Malus baccata]|uniref:Uncharacterized protein n=1 Tax=Malus baccata TaxID=106549 RepID=A0A540L0L4_MALBA|nr:hypothetical protein C1H46_034401 [Malus baccata]
MSSTRGENDSLSIHDSDLEFLTTSPSRSSLDCKDSMKNLNEGSGSNCSGNVSKEDADDGCLDDWEVVDLSQLISVLPTDAVMDIVPNRKPLDIIFCFADHWILKTRRTTKRIMKPFKPS